MAACNIDKTAVVLAIDSSRQAEGAFDWYLRNIHRDQYKLVFVHSIELPEIQQSRGMYVSPGVLYQLWEEQQAKSKELEEKYRAKLKEHSLHGQLKIMAGKPGEAIIKVAEDEKACMIVTGTRGMGTVRRTLLGSVSDYLIHHAKCPVIVFRETVSKK